MSQCELSIGNTCELNEKEIEAIELLKKGISLRDIPYQSESIVKFAIEESFVNLKFAKEEFITEEIVIAAIKMSSKSIRYIPNPSKNMCEAALKKSHLSFKYFNKSFESENIKIFVLKNEKDRCKNFIARFIDGKWLFSIYANEMLPKEMFIFYLDNISHKDKYLKVLEQF